MASVRQRLPRFHGSAGFKQPAAAKLRRTYSGGSVDDGILRVSEADVSYAILLAVQQLVLGPCLRVVDMQGVILAGTHKPVLRAVKIQGIDSLVSEILAQQHKHA